MSLNRNHSEWLAIAFFVFLAGVVFQQASTDLAEQGIASGDAFHNAAFYPKSVAILILCAVFVRTVFLIGEMKAAGVDLPSFTIQELSPSIKLIVLFGLYLYLLGVFGYHLTTAPFIAMVMFVCGERKPTQILFFSISVAFLIAFLFESFLKIVLPGGIFSISIAW